jgi:hypothetical protein
MASTGDFFKELFHRLDRDRLLRDPAADGSGVKVALVDTGVDAELIAQRCRERGHEPPKIEGVIFGLRVRFCPIPAGTAPLTVPRWQTSFCS